MQLPAAGQESGGRSRVSPASGFAFTVLVEDNEATLSLQLGSEVGFILQLLLVTMCCPEALGFREPGG